jgi:hypothetical protein
MSRLPKIQDAFQGYLLRGDTAVEALVVGTERVPISTRLSIYGDGYRSRLVEALQANFPVLSELLGEVDFTALGEAYVRSHESPFFSIRYYGNALADFLASEPKYSAAPMLADLARWEWMMTEVFDAADADAVGVADLARLAPEAWAELRFGLHPSVRRLSLAWNAPQIWNAVTDKEEPPEVEFSAEPVQWVLWRQELRTYFRSLQPGEAEALEGVRYGEPFGEICAQLSDDIGESVAPLRAAGFLRNWVESGMLTAGR